MPQPNISRSFWLQAIGILALLFCVGLFLFHSYDPINWAEGLPIWPRVLVMTLIGANVFLPMPSSFIMLATGHIIHHWMLAFCVSFTGSMLAWISWYWLGRLFGWTGRRAAPAAVPAEPVGAPGGANAPAPADNGANHNSAGADKISQHVRRYGVGVLIVTRPVPFLAELTAAACGIAHMNFWRFLAGAALGVAPMAAFYTWVAVMTKQSGDTWVAPLIAVLVPAGLYLLIVRPWRKKNSGQ